MSQVVENANLTIDSLPDHDFMQGVPKYATAQQQREQQEHQLDAEFPDATDARPDELQGALGTEFNNDTGNVGFSFVAIVSNPNEPVVVHWKNVCARSDKIEKELSVLEPHKAVPVSVRVLGTSHSSANINNLSLEIKDAGGRNLFTPISATTRSAANTSERAVGYPLMLLGADASAKRILKQSNELSTDHSQYWSLNEDMLQSYQEIKALPGHPAKAVFERDSVIGRLVHYCLSIKNEVVDNFMDDPKFNYPPGERGGSLKCIPMLMMDSVTHAYQVKLKEVQAMSFNLSQISINVAPLFGDNESVASAFPFAITIEVQAFMAKSGAVAEEPAFNQTFWRE
jgi:hypothetical protein